MSFMDTGGSSGRFLHPRAELGHHHRVGTEVVEEVAVDRHLLDVHEVGQHLGKRALDAARRGCP